MSQRILRLAIVYALIVAIVAAWVSVVSSW
jgi:hypothetical protein